MVKFTFEEPYLYKDKGNKKWLIRYFIKGGGIKSQYRKETGSNYDSKFNYIKNLKVRDIEANIILGLALKDLQDGVDPENKLADRRILMHNK